MDQLSHRERVLLALNHQDTDRVPMDLCGSTCNMVDALYFKVRDMLGIVGSNGAGKSTLLKAISNVMTPTTGKVTAKSAGKATITVTISNGKKASCNVTVNPQTNKITKIAKSGSYAVKINWSKISKITKAINNN